MLKNKRNRNKTASGTKRHKNADKEMMERAADSGDFQQPQHPPQFGAPLYGGQPAYHMPYGTYAGYHMPYAYGGGNFPGPFEQGIDLRELLQIMLRKWLLIVAITAFAVASAFFYLHMATPIYEASSLIELSLRRPRILSQQDAVIDDAGRLQSSEMLNTQLMKLQGASLRRNVAEQLEGQRVSGLPSGRKLEGFLRNNVNIELLRRSSLVKISARHPDPETAAMIAAAYANESVENAFRLNRETSQNAVAWLEEQIATQGQELAASEERLLDFKRANPMDTLDARRETIRESLLAYNRELTRAVAVRDELLARYTERHPEVIAQEQLIAAARNQYDSEISKLEEIEGQIAETRTRLLALERDKAAVEISYRGILSRMEEARLSADENTATIKIIEDADVPLRPVLPKKRLILLLALLAGGGFGCGLALLSDKLEDRIWGPEDVEQDIGLKMLGLVPRSEGTKEREDLAKASLGDKFSLTAEAFSGIRGILDTKEDMGVFLVTSTMPAEGKTICATNMAIMSAKSGKRTLLIDLDMRRPRQARIWKIADPEWSLLHALCDDDSTGFERLAQQTEIKGLDVIVSHVAQDISPAEVLGSKRTRELLEWAGSHYDRVIIDSPPVGVTSDAMVVGGLVDAVVMVGRFNKTKKRQAMTAVRRLMDGGAYILGMVINDVRYSKTSFGSYGYLHKHYKKAYGRPN